MGFDPNDFDDDNLWRTAGIWAVVVIGFICLIQIAEAYVK